MLYNYSSYFHTPEKEHFKKYLKAQNDDNINAHEYM